MSLTNDQLQRIKRIHETFTGLDDLTLEETIENFSGDRNPESEIRIFENIVIAYTSYCRNRDMSLDERKDVRQILLLRSMMPESEVLRSANLKVLSLVDAQEVMAGYPGVAKPVKLYVSE